MRDSAISRDVAAQRKHVLNAVLPELLQHDRHMFLGRGDTGQVCQHGHTVFFLQVGGDMNRVLTCAAARAICDAHKIRPQGCDLLCRLSDRLVCTAGFGRKHLK